MYVKRLALLLVAFMLLFGIALAGCSAGTGTDTGSEGSSSGENSTGGGSGTGTFEDPARIGNGARVADWEVTVTDVNFDALDVVLEAAPSNTPPDEGNKFVLVKVQVEYVGDTSGTAWLDLADKLYVDGGTTINEAARFIPNSLVDGTETFPGGVMNANLLYEVPEDVVDRVALVFQPSYNEDDVSVFFALGDYLPAK